MTDNTGKGERSAPQRRRKPLTIDLPAEAVERKPAAEGSAPAAPSAEPAGAAAPADSPAAAEPVPPRTPEPAAEPAPATEPEPPREAPRAKSAAAAADKRDASRPPPTSPAAASSAKSDPSIAFVPLVVAAIMGGVLVALVVVLLARGGAFLPEPDTRIADLSAEVTALKEELAGFRQAAAADPAAPFQEELAALRQSITELQSGEPPSAADLTDLQTRLSALGEDVAALKTTAPADSSAVASEVASLRAEVGALSAKVESVPDNDRDAALETKVGEASAKIDDAAALGPAVAADALAAALESGRPFATELSALRTLAIEASTLDALAPHAESGLPTLAALRADFEREIATVDLTPAVPEGTGVMDRLMRSARGLVEVRPAHPTEGADPAAVVTRIRASLDAGDLRTALAEREALPDTAKAATRSFAEGAEARSNADDLVAKLRAEALSRLETGH